MMSGHQRRSKLYPNMLAAVCAALLLGFLLQLRVTADPAVLPPRPDPATNPKKVSGGFIELQASGQPAGLWTGVQWQDGQGAWHDVGGWQGSLSDESRLTWYVGQEHLGTGPFRWLVFPESKAAGPLASPSFYLPEKAGQTVQVSLSLPKTRPATTLAPLEPTQAEVPLAGEIRYVVRPGDTLAGIAGQFNSSVAVLARKNQIANVNYIYVGQQLIIPAE